MTTLLIELVDKPYKYFNEAHLGSEPEAPKVLDLGDVSLLHPIPNSENFIMVG